MKLLLKGAAIALCLAPAPSHAYTIERGADLRESCSAVAGASLRESMQASFCAGFIRAAFDQLWVNEIRKGNRPQQCVPEVITTQQIIGMVKNYLKENPPQGDALAVMIIENALRNAFPGCFTGPA